MEDPRRLAVAEAEIARLRLLLAEARAALPHSVRVGRSWILVSRDEAFRGRREHVPECVGCRLTREIGVVLGDSVDYGRRREHR